MPESVVLQGVTSSMLGSFLSRYHILSISSSKLYSAACILPYKQQIRQWPAIPGFHTPYSSRCQLATRAALLWLALLCHKGATSALGKITFVTRFLPSENKVYTYIHT